MTENTETPAMTREEILLTTLKGREQEIMHYQLNIDNYTLALDNIVAMNSIDRAELAGFVDQLTGLLASERLEQKKAKVMLAVLKQQLGD